MDLLLRFPNSELAVAFGQSIGATAVGEEGATTAAVHGGMAIHVIGTHGYPDPLSTDETPLPLVTVPGWWVMVRAPEGTPIPPEIEPLIVAPDPDNPEIPNRIWA